jgi:hypothetical protein
VEELTSRFSLDAIKFNAFVLFGMIAVWVVVLVSAIFSILSKPFSRRQKLFWIVFTIAAPPLGVLAYLPFSFNREDLPDLLFGRKHRKHAKRTKPAVRRLPEAKK